MKGNGTVKNGISLSYTDLGDRSGFPLLVQHGLIATIEADYLFDRLVQAGRRVISIARPGYGDSSPCLMDSFADWAELVAGLIEELQISQFDVLAMSSGAPYGYALGWKFPQKVRHIYIFSGIPALYDEEVLRLWPFPPIRNKTMPELESLAKDLFFSWVTEADLQKKDIRDSMRNNCFGIAQDLRLRFADWGFSLAEVPARVFMRHSRTDDSVPFQAAIRTAGLLPHCRLELTETGPHFSPDTLADFFEKTILGQVEKVG